MLPPHGDWVTEARVRPRPIVSPGACEGFKSAATSRSLGNRGYVCRLFCKGTGYLASCSGNNSPPSLLRVNSRADLDMHTRALRSIFMACKLIN